MYRLHRLWGSGSGGRRGTPRPFAAIYSPEAGSGDGGAAVAPSPPSSQESGRARVLALWLRSCPSHTSAAGHPLVGGETMQQLLRLLQQERDRKVVHEQTQIGTEMQILLDSLEFHLA